MFKSQGWQGVSPALNTSRVSSSTHSQKLAPTYLGGCYCQTQFLGNGTSTYFTNSEEQVSVLRED